MARYSSRILFGLSIPLIVLPETPPCFLQNLRDSSLDSARSAAHAVIGLSNSFWDWAADNRDYFPFSSSF
jgi:hypothetical protein